MADAGSGGRRIAFVTGASYGIGAATALALARDGCDVAVAATRLGNLQATVAAVEAAGARAAPFALDVCSQASVERAMEDVVSAFGRVDVLVNNAATTARRDAVDITRGEWEALMRTNLDGTFFMCQQMGRHLIEGKRAGCIVNIASTHGIVGFAQRAAYGISKAAVIHMTRMLAIEWAQHGIRVNAVAPGRVASGSPLRADAMQDEKYVAMANARIPLKRPATNEEVAAAVRYLASEDASYMTGHTLVLDGGVTAQ